jgi:hypothetical protein
MVLLEWVVESRAWIDIPSASLPSSRRLVTTLASHRRLRLDAFRNLECCKIRICLTLKSDAISELFALEFISAFSGGSYPWDLVNMYGAIAEERALVIVNGNKVTGSNMSYTR